MRDRWSWLRSGFSVIAGIWLAVHQHHPAVSLRSFLYGLTILVAIHICWVSVLLLEMLWAYIKICWYERQLRISSRRAP